MKFFIRIAKWLAILVGVLILALNALVYRMEARSRSMADNWTISMSTEDDGKYTLKYDYIGRGLLYIKLYDTATNELLATRTFYHGGVIQLNWEKDHLGYDTTEQSWFDRGKIDLPPSKLDKLLTYLP